MKSYDILAIREYFPSVEDPSPSSWVYNQVKGIQELGVDPLVISPTPRVPLLLKKILKKKHTWKIKPCIDIKPYMGVDVIRPEYSKMPSRFFLHQNIKNVSACLQNTLSNIDFKIIHAHFGHAGISALPLKANRKVPLITSFYGFDLGADKDKLRPYYRELARKGDLFLALSEDMANDLLELKFPSDRIVIHHVGVDIDKFSIHDSTQKKEFVFTIVATFEERKGLQFVIHAFKEFLTDKDLSKFQLRLVGDGPFISELKRLANGSKNIIFINNFSSDNPRETVLNEMQMADVFLLTSITTPSGEKEGTPVVLMEAQACGKPCISTYHAGIPEVVVDGTTGILTEERNTKQIVHAMEQLYKEYELRQKFGTAARIHIEQNFNNQIQNQKLRTIYKSLII